MPSKMNARSIHQPAIPRLPPSSSYELSLCSVLPHVSTIRNSRPKQELEQM